ncbi:MAG TPA: RluA family pseudouridine synthase [Anaerolineales bacterium]
MEILHLDESVIVVNKPAGLPVLPDGWNPAAPYLVGILEETYGRHSNTSKAGIWNVHRLDKTTSGVIVFARTAEAHRDLNLQFERHEVAKIYHAILVGVPSWEERIAKHPLRMDVGHKHRTAVDNGHGKPSETRFKVLRCFALHTLVEARLMTGRTHQIRAHAYALGFPLLGDVLYGSEPSPLIDRPALHAYSLTIRSPQTHEKETFIAPYPDDFSRALEQLSV